MSKIAKRSLKELDAGQLDLMWSCLKLRKKNSCTKSDVKIFKENLDKIRLALIQKTGGQRGNDTEINSVYFEELGTYINFAIVFALTLYVYGGLDVLENILPEDGEKNG